jgi:hypothetical protein
MRRSGRPEPERSNEGEVRHAPIGTPRSAGDGSERAALEQSLTRTREKLAVLDRERQDLEKEARALAD